jgi:hypothetical protein
LLVMAMVVFDEQTRGRRHVVCCRARGALFICKGEVSSVRASRPPI